MKNKKICFLIPSVSSGGIEMYVLRFLRYLNGSLDITVVVRNNHREELYAEYQKTGARLIFKPLGYLNLFKIFSYILFFKREQFDVICDFNSNFGGIPMWIATLSKTHKRIVFYRQGRNHFQPSMIKNRVNEWMNFLVFRYSTHILSNSFAALDFFFRYRDLQDPRFMVINNGIEMGLYNRKEDKMSVRLSLQLPTNVFLIGHVGRFDPAKNHITLLRVIRQLLDRKIAVHLALCGRDTEKLERMIEGMALQKHVSILGYRSDIAYILHAFDCFIFPSVTEGQPNALIEAMASGLPIIASDIGPIKECVPESHWDFLVDPMDDQAMAEKMVSLIENPGRYKSEEALLYVKNCFDDNKNFSLFKNILEND